MDFFVKLMENLKVSYQTTKHALFALYWKAMKQEKIFALEIVAKGRDGYCQNLRHKATEAKLPQQLNKIVEMLNIFVDGKPIPFPLDFVDTENMVGFEKDILFCLKKNVPPSKVVSYGRLAELAGYRNAARATGSVMSCNRLPIFFPCHRVVKSEGFAGSYGPGKELKKYFLSIEGITFDDATRIPKGFFI